MWLALALASPAPYAAELVFRFETGLQTEAGAPFEGTTDCDFEPSFHPGAGLAYRCAGANHNGGDVPGAVLPTGSFTVMAWVRPTGAAFGQDSVIFSEGNTEASGGEGFAFFIDDGGILTLELQDDADGEQILGMTGPLDINLWVWVSAVYDETRQLVSFYQDGVWIQDLPFVGVVDHGGAVRIGNQTNRDYGFEGDLDEVRVFYRALNAAEIDAMWVWSHDGDADGCLMEADPTPIDTGCDPVDTGATGDTGASGDTGYTGATGDTGASRDTGYSGATGDTSTSSTTADTSTSGDTSTSSTTADTSTSGDTSTSSDTGGTTADTSTLEETGSSGHTGHAPEAAVGLDGCRCDAGWVGTASWFRWLSRR